MNFYNENDPFAAAWLRELIKADAIAPGIVDERSIEDIKPEELNGYTQCHFFAGIGVWSYALRRAGWPDDRPVWTGSCPCQPFSSAGQGKGFADERHLWPSWFHLISQCKPDTIFGEQVEAAIRTGWLDLVQNDLEGENYAFGAVPFPACSVGAPHIRQRLYFVGHSTGQFDSRDGGRKFKQGIRQQGAIGRSSISDKLGDSLNSRLQGLGQSGFEFSSEGREGSQRYSSEAGVDGGLGIANSNGSQSRNESTASARQGNSTVSTSFWSECSWLPCIDGKTRPVEPSTSPLAYGVTNRVGRLRGYGNAIVAPQAQAFVESYLESCSVSGQ